MCQNILPNSFQVSKLAFLDENVLIKGRNEEYLSDVPSFVRPPSPLPKNAFFILTDRLLYPASIPQLTNEQKTKGKNSGWTEDPAGTSGEGHHAHLHRRQRRYEREKGDFNKKSKFINVHQRKNLR
jgi:hypothetical protein